MQDQYKSLEIEILTPKNGEWERFEDLNGNRFYYPKKVNKRKPKIQDVKILAGITTCVKKVYPTSPHVIEWMMKNPQGKLRELADFGSTVHYAILKYLTGEPYQTCMHQMYERFNDVCREVMAFQRFKKDVKFEVLAIEIPLKGNIGKCEMVATLDLVLRVKGTVEKTVMVQDGEYTRGEKKGQPKMVKGKEKEEIEEIWVVDIKSNSQNKDNKDFYHDSHLPQLIAQKAIWEQNYPNLKVDRIMNYASNNWTSTPSYKLCEWVLEGNEKSPLSTNKKGYNNGHVTAFRKYMDICHDLGHNKPSGRILIYNSFSVIDEDEMQPVEELSYQEWALKKITSKK